MVELDLVIIASLRRGVLVVVFSAVPSSQLWISGSWHSLVEVLLLQSLLVALHLFQRSIQRD